MTTANTSPITSIKIYTDKRKRNCTYQSLETFGLPELKTIQFHDGATTSSKVSGWLRKSWMSNPTLTRQLVAILSDFRSGELKSLPVQTSAAKQALLGVMTFINEREAELTQLNSIYFPDLSLGDTPIPPISKIFDNMSFLERQAILKANNDAKLEFVD